MKKTHAGQVEKLLLCVYIYIYFLAYLFMYSVTCVDVYIYIYVYTYVCMHPCMDGWMEGLKDGRMEGWKDGRMEGWKDGWMDGFMAVLPDLPAIRAYLESLVNEERCSGERPDSELNPGRTSRFTLVCS